MISYYYKVYNGNLDDILSEISLKGLSDINGAIDNENDIVLANAIFFCINKLAMWRKEDIAYKIWNKLSPLYKDINFNPQIYDAYNVVYCAGRGGCLFCPIKQRGAECSTAKSVRKEGNILEMFPKKKK